MRHLRWALPAAVVLALCASSAAAANDSRHGHPIVAPAGNQQVAEWFKTMNELPAPVNPLWGSGPDPCVRFGPHGRLLAAITFGEVVTCTAELGTVVTTGGGHFCASFDPPDSPFYAVGRQEQRRCAWAVRNIAGEAGMRVSVDGGPWVDIFGPRFTALTPQTRVHLPVDNVWGVPPQTGTITASGWFANIHNLRIGRHHYTTEVSFVDGTRLSFPHVVNIVPRRHWGDDD